MPTINILHTFLFDYDMTLTLSNIVLDFGMTATMFNPQDSSILHESDLEYDKVHPHVVSMYTWITFFHRQTKDT